VGPAGIVATLWTLREIPAANLESTDSDPCVASGQGIP
jgi:hypothetical protein